MGSNVPVTMDGAYGSFTMPDANATIKVGPTKNAVTF